MARDFPELVDPWRMIDMRREFGGTLPVSRLKRLQTMLADSSGQLMFDLSFRRDALDRALIDVSVNGEVQMVCQRSLKPFAVTVAVDNVLALYRHEVEERSAECEYDPILVSDGQVSIAELIEDEVMLSLPLVPKNPQHAVIEPEVQEQEPEPVQPNPFAVLQQLKDS